LHIARCWLEKKERFILSELEDKARHLADFGLTPYEAKVYLTAVRLGLASASSISRAAEIRREEVYRTLPRLEKAGLIERVLGRPVKVRALPVDTALSMLIKRKERQAKREITDLNTKRKDFLNSFRDETIPLESTPEESHFILISDRDAVTSRITSLIGSAVREIDVLDSSDNIMRFILQYSDDLEKARRRNVSLRVVTECQEDEYLIPETLEKHIPSESFILKYVQDMPSRYILFDGSEAMITTSKGGTFSDSKCLWTDDGSLVGLIQSNFQEQLRSAQDWRTYERTPSDRMNRVLNQLKPRDHVILVYDSPEAKRDTLFSYIQQGLERGHAAKYVCSEESCQAIREAMNDFGLKVSKYEKTGALGVMNYTDIYIRDGAFSIEQTMDSWERLYEEAMDNGFKGMRVTGEMACFIEHSLVEDLIEYEKALHTILDIPMTAICAYNADSLAKVDNPIDVYSELVKAHGKVLFAGKYNTEGKIEIRIA
jgi:sugar-specific transcriptional regulator TrmB